MDRWESAKATLVEIVGGGNAKLPPKAALDARMREDKERRKYGPNGPWW